MFHHLVYTLCKALDTCLHTILCINACKKAPLCMAIYKEVYYKALSTTLCTESASICFHKLLCTINKLLDKVEGTLNGYILFRNPSVYKVDNFLCMDKYNYVCKLVSFCIFISKNVLHSYSNHHNSTCICVHSQEAFHIYYSNQLK